MASLLPYPENGAPHRPRLIGDRLGVRTVKDRRHPIQRHRHPAARPLENLAAQSTNQGFNVGPTDISPRRAGKMAASVFLCELFTRT
jgi:hypothetical protein